MASVLLGAAASAVALPVQLRVDQQTNPLGLDQPQPMFAWQSDATARDWKQTAYEVRVAGTREAAQQGRGDVWDSGKVVSGESVDVRYAGPALASRRQLFWTVTTWDGQGHREQSTPAQWEMGLLRPADWQAQWIGRVDSREQEAMGRMQWLWLHGGDAERAEAGSEVEFRLLLHLRDEPASASLHVLAAGTYTTTVNGVDTGHKQDWGSFDWEDVRGVLHWGEGAAGDNSVVVHLKVPGQKASGKTVPAAMAAALELDGQQWVVSDGSWQAREGAGAWSPAEALGPLASRHFGVSTDRHSPAPTPERIVSGASLLRKTFVVRGKVARARLYVTALGSYQAQLNGKVVGSARLTPGFTDYRKRVLYQTYDVTSLLAPGNNVLGAVLGAGWHGSPLLWSGTRLFPGVDRLRAQLELTMADGTVQKVASDETWQASSAPVVSSEIYGGEAYDARLEQPGWSTAVFKPGQGWAAVSLGHAPEGLAVTAQPDAPVHRAQSLTPVAVRMVAAGAGSDAVFDMGQNMVGVVRLQVRGPRGTTVRLRFAERLNPDGSVYRENLRDADATDWYTLKGGGEESWSPLFTFHGFRYVQVSGYPGKPPLNALEGEVWNSLPDRPAMRLETASGLLNQMDQLGLWGQRGNFVSIPTDCPQRDERMGWMGDAGVFWRTGAYNFDIGAFSHKFMQDIVDGQNEDGSFSNISPNLLEGLERDPGAPGWGDAGVLVPYATWLQYGDRALLAQNWPAMERSMAFILRTNPNYLRQKELGPNYADWLAPDPRTPSDLVATAYWALIARQMQTMASALGKREDAARYGALYGRIKTAYQQAYLVPTAPAPGQPGGQPEDGLVKGDTQTAYVLTLYAGLAPKEQEARMTARLVANIAAHGEHLTTGFLGTPFLLSVLDTEGRSDVAYSLLLSQTYPSWGYMVEKGATTWWERWNGDTGDPSMNSYNHYAFGSVMAWVYRRVAGIDADPNAPGFRHILISPHVDARLTHARAEYDSAYGTIATDWTASAGGRFHLALRVPPNTTATVHLPATATSVGRRDGRPAAMTYAAGALVSEVGAGSYTFDVEPK